MRHTRASPQHIHHAVHRAQLAADGGGIYFVFVPMVCDDARADGEVACSGTAAGVGLVLV